MWKDLKLSVIDTETTGLDTKKDRIIEIAILCYEEGKLTDRFVTLVNPMCDFDKEEIFKRNGIREEEILSAPPFANIINDIFERINDRILVAYNVPFDRDMLKNEFQRNNFEFPEKQWIDPLVLARGIFKEKRNRLNDVAERLGLDVKELHRAEPDAEILSKILFAFSNYLPQSLEDLFLLQKEWERKGDVGEGELPSLGLSFIYGNFYDPDPMKAIFADYPSLKSKIIEEKESKEREF